MTDGTSAVSKRCEQALRASAARKCCEKPLRMFTSSMFNVHINLNITSLSELQIFGNNGNALSMYSRKLRRLAPINSTLLESLTE